MMKFLLVNDRQPRNDAYCVLCCEPITESYVREVQTRLLYCDPRCFAATSRWQSSPSSTKRGKCHEAMFLLPRPIRAHSPHLQTIAVLLLLVRSVVVVRLETLSKRPQTELVVSLTPPQAQPLHPTSAGCIL
jgi:hypothetical protein